MRHLLASDWLRAANEAYDWSRSDPPLMINVPRKLGQSNLGLVKYNLYLRMPEILSFFTGLLRRFDIKLRVDLFWHQTSWVFVFSGCEPHHTLTAPLGILFWNIEASKKMCSKNIYFRILAGIALWLIINLPLHYKNDQMTTIISPFYPWRCWNLKNSLPRTML